MLSKSSTEQHQAVEDKVSTNAREHWTSEGKAFLKSIAAAKVLPAKGVNAMDFFSPVDCGLQNP
jgi:hypothetical protein